MKIAIKNARIYDPASGREGNIGTVLIEGGRIVDNIDTAQIEIDAEGRVLMAGAIDVNAHMATYGLNFIRSCGLLPAERDIGEAYVHLGYTFVNEAFVTLHTAAYTHYELSSVPWLHTSIFLSLPLYDLENFVRSGDVEKCARVVTALGEISKCIGFRLFEPELYYEQDIYSHRNIEASRLLEFFARVADTLKLRIFVHPREASVSLISSYPESYHLSSVCELLAGNSLKELKAVLDSGASVDTGFIPSGNHLRILPEPQEIPGQVFKFDIGLTHPVYYVLASGEENEETNKLMDLLDASNDYKMAFSMMLPAKDLSQNCASLWASIASRFGFSFLARITRNVPAEILGIVDRGNLNIGSTADIAIYDVETESDQESMKQAFSSCWCLLKDGEIIISDGEIVGSESNKKTWFRKFSDSDREEALKILRQSSFRPENLEITDEIAGSLAEISEG
ncbi:MAG TPA: hypothetical protein ENG51_01460 [Deltaproteobacteria bacterium]|nr:hypothetical protein [Deltaproteobacteria bacterium]